jgi:hypothetical protein
MLAQVPSLGSLPPLDEERLKQIQLRRRPLSLWTTLVGAPLVAIKQSIENEKHI